MKFPSFDRIVGFKMARLRNSKSETIYLQVKLYSKVMAVHRIPIDFSRIILLPYNCHFKLKVSNLFW